MSVHTSRVLRFVAVLLVLPLLSACSRTTAAVTTAGAAAAAAVTYNDRGAETTSSHPVGHLANATEAAFRDLGIVLTERETLEDGIELKGTEGDWKIVVDIERDADEPHSEIEVSVSKDEVNYDKSRAENILNAIIARAGT